MFIDRFSKKHKNKKFYKINEVVDLIKKTKGKVFEIDKNRFLLNRKLKLIVKSFNENNSIVCPICGRKASHFRIDKDLGLNLYGFQKNKDVTNYTFFNVDHVFPKSLFVNYTPNKEDLSRKYQLTCERCNSEKSDSINGLKKSVFNNEMKLHKKYMEILTYMFITFDFKKNIKNKIKRRNSNYGKINKRVKSYFLNNAKEIILYLINYKVCDYKKYCLNGLKKEFIDLFIVPEYRKNKQEKLAYEIENKLKFYLLTNYKRITGEEVEDGK